MPLFFFTVKQEKSRRAVCRVGAGASALVISIAMSAGPALAETATSSAAPALRAQARELYAPVTTYEHSTSPAERSRSRSAAGRVGKVIDSCQRPYQKHLFRGLVVSNNPRYKLYRLYENGALMQTYQADVKPVATQLSMLASSWAALSLRDRAMNEFVHAVAAEFHATLDAAPFDSCGFVKQIAAHHFSYAWAKQSSDGMQAARWWKQIGQAGNRTSAFWHYVYPVFGAPEPPNAGAHLFTKHELTVLPNLPGELG
jgi:hypothetical protein